MGAKQEQFVRDFCDAWGDGSDTSRPDVEKILSMMSEDAVWQLWIPGGPIVEGKDALRKEILQQMSYATNNKCNITHIVSSDTVVMTERADDAIIHGKPCPHQMVAVYELDKDGLICAWREYLDTADLAKKVGISPETMTA